MAESCEWSWRRLPWLYLTLPPRGSEVADGAGSKPGYVLDRRVRRPPRTARHKGRRIASRHRFRTVPAGKRLQHISRVWMPGHPFSVARHGVYACTFDSMRRIRKVRMHRKERCELLHARLMAGATREDAIALMPRRRRHVVPQIACRSLRPVTFSAYQ